MRHDVVESRECTSRVPGVCVELIVNRGCLLQERTGQTEPGHRTDGAWTPGRRRPDTRQTETGHQADGDRILDRRSPDNGQLGPITARR